MLQSVEFSHLLPECHNLDNRMVPITASRPIIFVMSLNYTISAVVFVYKKLRKESSALILTLFCRVVKTVIFLLVTLSLFKIKQNIFFYWLMVIQGNVPRFYDDQPETW